MEALDVLFLILGFGALALRYLWDALNTPLGAALLLLVPVCMLSGKLSRVYLALAKLELEARDRQDYHHAQTKGEIEHNFGHVQDEIRSLQQDIWELMPEKPKKSYFSEDC